MAVQERSRPIQRPQRTAMFRYGSEVNIDVPGIYAYYAADRYSGRRIGYAGFRLQFLDLIRWPWQYRGGALPFREFVLKVHSRCDLACDHCYVYEHADQSWLSATQEHRAGNGREGGRADCRARPPAVPGRGSRHPARRRATARGRAGLGGSPARCGRRSRPVCALDLRIHTNGVRLDEEFCELFRAERIKVGSRLTATRPPTTCTDGRRRAQQLRPGDPRYRPAPAGALP